MEQEALNEEFMTAQELQTVHWCNSDGTLTLAGLRGRVVLIEAFQMLCPAGVSQGLPQAQRVAQLFDAQDICVLGLHTVFEHHAAQGTREALEAFLHEYRITFPVGIDAPAASGGLPRTMAACGMRGTPTLLLIDHLGRLRKHAFGVEQDLALGAEIMALISEARAQPASMPSAESLPAGCDKSGCSVPSIGQHRD
jgi:hypothetical protein